MHSFIYLLLLAALMPFAMGADDCTENLMCPPDALEVCVLHSELYCFIKYENLCAWNLAKCKYNLNYQIFALKFCDLENFACKQTKSEYNQ